MTEHQPSFQVKVYTAEELYSTQNTVILAQVIDLVNDAYAAIQGGDLRLKTRERLGLEITEEGLCAVVLDVGSYDNEPVEEEEEEEKKVEGEVVSNGLEEARIGRVVATASVHLFHDQPNHHEYGCVASLNEPRYRRKGLIDLCLRAVEAALILKHSKTSASTTTSLTSITDNGNGSKLASDIKMYVGCIDYVNEEYWRRKGFVEVERKVMPVGHWGYEGAWSHLTMCRGVMGSQD